MQAAHGNSNQQRSFPELVGRNAQAASAYVARQGLNFLNKSMEKIDSLLFDVQ